jgi:hypothetical protein
MQRPTPTLKEFDEERRSYHITNTFNSLGIDLSILAESLLIKEAREYLLYGVARRLPIIQMNFRTIFDIAYASRLEILELLEESTLMNMHLHSFFYHCYGALDNAAWCLAYEKNFLAPGADWTKKKHKISFQKEEYSKWLKQTLPVLWSSLKKAEQQHQALTGIRDAIAHRIPLYVPSAITPEQVQDQTRLYAEANQCEKFCDEYFTLREKAQNMGFFVPIFHIEGDLNSPYQLRECVIETSDYLLQILAAVSAELAAKGPANDLSRQAKEAPQSGATKWQF